MYSSRLSKAEMPTIPTFVPPQLPLLGPSHHPTATHDPQEWAQAVCSSTPGRICEPLNSNQKFLITSAVLSFGDVLMISTQGSAITLQTDQHHSAQLLLPYNGSGSWTIDNDVYINLVGESILYLPQAPLMLDNDLTSGVALNLNPAMLISTALTMAGPAGLSSEQLAVFGQPRKLFLADPSVGSLIHALFTLLSSLDQLSATRSLSAQLIRFDDILTRLAVLLLLPELNQCEAADDVPMTSFVARRRLQPLLDWLDANLSSELALSDLEAQAYMSRRNLQYTFRRAYDCTPMQWLRRRRLELAMQRLQHSQPKVGIATISRELGFMSLATFSREFRRQFGCSPSSIRLRSR